MRLIYSILQFLHIFTIKDNPGRLTNSNCVFYDLGILGGWYLFLTSVNDNPLPSLIRSEMVTSNPK